MYTVCMKYYRPRGIGLISTLLAFTGLVVFLAAVGLLLSQERARVRDSRRIADMVRVQFAFETLFREKASYADAAAGCSQVGSPVASCELAQYLPMITTFKDPGRFSYRVAKVPDDTDYQIGFRLERGYDNLAAGQHTVSRDGIK